MNFHTHPNCPNLLKVNIFYYFVYIIKSYFLNFNLKSFYLIHFLNFKVIKLLKINNL